MPSPPWNIGVWRSIYTCAGSPQPSAVQYLLEKQGLKLPPAGVRQYCTQYDDAPDIAEWSTQARTWLFCFVSTTRTAHTFTPNNPSHAPLVVRTAAAAVMSYIFPLVKGTSPVREIAWIAIGFKLSTPISVTFISCFQNA
jgi:hypothetical protein